MTDTTLFEKYSDAYTTDIGLCYCGKRGGTKNHVYGPEARSHYLLVLVEKGSAVLTAKGGDIEFGSGELLIMFPGEAVHYRALTDWSIRWLGLSGNSVGRVLASLGATPDNPTIKPLRFAELDGVMARIYEARHDGTPRSRFCVQTLLHEFFALLLDGIYRRESFDAVTSARRMIDLNLGGDISVRTLADSVFLDESYFSRLFKSQCGLSPKKYILAERINKAKHLLRNSDYPIAEISLRVGFRDALYFSRVFKKAVGVSPSEYRRQ